MKTKKSFLWLVFLILATIWILARRNQKAEFNTASGFVFGTVYKIAYQHDADLKPEIEAELLKKFRTSQRKLYHAVDGLLLLDFELLGRRYGLPALDEQANALAARRYVSNVFYSLITTGQIIRKVIKGNPAYRTAMKCELPASRKKQVKPSHDTPELF